MKKREVIVVAVALIGITLLSAGFLHNRPLYMSDTITYVDGARSLVAGQGYQQNAVPVTVRPPGYSFLLTIPIAVGLDSIAAFKLLNVLVAGAALFVFFLCMKQVVGQYEALLLSVLTGVLFPWIYYSHAILSDIMFALVMGLFVLGAMKHRATGSTGSLLLMTVATALAPIVRYAGIALFPAWLYVAYFANDRLRNVLNDCKWKQVGLLVVMGLVVILPLSAFVVRNSILTGAVTSYSTGVNPEYALSLKKIGITEFSLTTRLWVNVRGYLHVFIVPDQVGIARVSDLPAVASGICLLLWLLMLSGWGVCMARRSSRPIAVTCFFYLLLLQFNTWYDIRYLLPILPLLLMFALLSSRWLLDRSLIIIRVKNTDLRRKIVNVAAATALILGLVGNTGFALCSHKGKRLRAREYDGMVQRLYEACSFIKNEPEPGEVLVAGGAGFVPLWTGRSVRSTLDLLDANRALSSMSIPKDVAFILLDESKFIPYREEYLEPLVAANVDRLAKVVENRNTLVYRVH